MSGSAHQVDLPYLRWLYTDWKTLENGVSDALGFGVEVLELRGEGGGSQFIHLRARDLTFRAFLSAYAGMRVES